MTPVSDCKYQINKDLEITENYFNNKLLSKSAYRRMKTELLLRQQKVIYQAATKSFEDLAIALRLFSNVK